jgi:hypothetical protein
MASIFAGPFWPWRAMGSWLRCRFVTPQTNFLPLFWIPPEAAVRPILMGGVAVPWGEWAIPLLFWAVFYATLLLFFLSWASIFRRQWIDVEMLPFPYTTMVYTTTSVVISTENQRTRRKFFFYGLIIGILVYLPPLVNLAFPYIPDIYGWRTSPLFDWSTQGAFHAAQVFPALGSTIVGFFAIQTNPGATAIAYLVPMHTLIGVTLFSIIFVYIIPQIAYYMGYYSGILTVTTTGSRVHRIYTEPPLKYEAMNFGVYIGILIFWLVLNWRYIAGTLKMAVRARGEKLEAGEPQRYLEAYITLVLSSIVMVALLIASGLDMVTAPIPCNGISHRYG